MWPSRQKESEVPNPEATNEKTPAELIAESLGGLEQRLGERMTALSTRVEEVANQTKPAPRPEPRHEAPEITSVLDNEDQAFAQRLTPVVAMQLEMQARLARNDVQQEYSAAGYGEAWAAFKKEIDGVLDNSPLVGGDGKPCRGNAEYIRNVADMVLGRAARAAGIKFGGKEKSFFIESANGGGDPNPNTPEANGLSAEQVKVLNRMGVSLADGVKTKAKLKFV